MPYSGPASAYGVIGKTDAAYFKMVNDNGGVNGRKITLISLDDGYSPPKTVEQIRRLVEQEQVALIFNSLGTPSNAAIRPYLNENKVPQLFVATGAAMWDDPKNFPWTMGWQPNYQTEARIYGKHILATKPDAKIGVLYQNDGFGKDYLTGLKNGLGADHAGLVMKEVSYEVSEPTIEFAGRRLAGFRRRCFRHRRDAEIRRAGDPQGLSTSAGRPVRYMTNVSPSIATVLKPAGLEKSKGLITAYYGKDPTDARWKDDAGFKEFAAFVGKYMTPTDLTDANAVYGFGAAATMVQVLKQCGERSVARKHHETGRKPQRSGIADDAAGHEDQHLARQFRADQTDAARLLQRRELGAVRRSPAGLTRRTHRIR